LNTAHTQLQTLINAELAKIATAILGVGGSYAPTPLNVSITAAKINQIKTP
jgi:hypothetical protein